jgi:diguanylate cyclase (GGDEF)-like protein
MRRPLDFCCRWGGEELVALLPDTDVAGASKVAGHILESVRETAITLIGYPPINITVSIGIACGHHASNQAVDNNLVDRADQAMYRAKQAGRDQYSL